MGWTSGLPIGMPDSISRQVTSETMQIPTGEVIQNKWIIAVPFGQQPQPRAPARSEPEMKMTWPHAWL